MNFDECIRWLYSFQKFGVKLGLGRIKHLCEELGNPQDAYQIIHVAGTNGKGSVCKYIGSILTNSGYKVGVYTSPHLQRFSERFVIDDVEISNDDIISLVEKIKPIVEQMRKKGDNPTFFEVVTAMAFLYFKEQNVDYAIIEVGLGGKFDATNIVNPLLSVITNVSLEHQDTLGSSVKGIAEQKAGIIKEAVPVITAGKSDALDVIKKVANNKDSSLTVVDSKSWQKLGSKRFLIQGSLNDYTIQTSLRGNFQAENIAVAIATVEHLEMNGVFIPDTAISLGVQQASNAGRMEIVADKPFILLDGAHNISAMKVLKESLENDFEFEKLILVLGILSDKNIEEMLKIISPIAGLIVVTESKNDRAAKAVDLKRLLGEIGYKNEIVIKNEIDEAILFAKSSAKKDDLICITGSLFTVGEAREIIL